LTSIFSLLIPPCPLCTLFPYTTLFRSLRDVQMLMVANRQVPDLAPDGREQVDHRLCHAHDADEHESRHPERCPGQEQQHVKRGQDRKSTRLNSSHSQISYAVFCLKKKC